MANPNADFPTTVHDPTDISAYGQSALGKTAKKHTEVEGKQEAEIVAIEQKIGSGASTPAAGYFLKGTGAGTSAWSATEPKGDTGVTGAKGDTGVTGSQGGKGDTGSQGNKGDTGVTGSQGSKGDTGTTGASGAKGDTGVTGSQGAKGDTGTTGATGAKGDTGTTGATGAKGDTGATGSQGAKGDTGATGSQGAKGDTGATGSTGAKGDTGATGSQGAKGDTGTTGSQGAKGDTGSTGTTGAKGDTGVTGAKGDTGNFGGDSFAFTFSTTTTDTDPGNGKLQFNNATYSSVTTIYVDLLDTLGTDITAWLDSLDDVVNSITGVLKLYAISDNTKWVTFKINAWTTATGYRKLTVTYVASNGALTTTAGDTVMSFSPAGYKGDTGTTGSQGAKGDTGTTGSTGAKGDTGATGSQGSKGDTGSTGSTGAKGDTGTTGSTGAKGDTGSTGAKGDTGSLSLTPAPGTDRTASGLTASLTAGETLVFGSICYIGSTGKVYKAKADVIAKASALYMCVDQDGVATDGTGTFMILGYARLDAWNWTVGGLLYLDAANYGYAVQTAPSATDQVIQILGQATHADRLFFSPQLVQVEHT